MAEPMKIAVIIPAAGMGERFGIGSGKSKLETDLAGRAVLIRALELFSGRPEVCQIIVAANPDKLDEFRFKWADKLGFLGATIVAGGKAERWETVRNALTAVSADATHVAVHDAARPVTDAKMIDRVFAAAALQPAVIPAVRASATIKKTEPKPVATPEAADPLDAILGHAGKAKAEAYKVTATIPRQDLWLVQTPQVIERSLMDQAYGQIDSGAVDTSDITDDAGLVEALGHDVVVVEGDPLNVKITVPDDLAFAAAVVQARSGKSAEDLLGPKRKFPTWAESEDE